MLHYLELFEEFRQNLTEAEATLKKANLPLKNTLTWAFLSPLTRSESSKTRLAFESVLNHYQSQNRIHEKNVLELLQDCGRKEGFSDLKHYISILSKLLQQNSRYQAWFDTEFYALLRERFAPEWDAFDLAFSLKDSSVFKNGLLCSTMRKKIFESIQANKWSRKSLSL